MSKENTTVDTVDMDLNALLNPGADSVMLPPTEQETPKNSIFSRKAEDLSFLNKPIEQEKPAAQSAENVTPNPQAEQKPAAETPNPLDIISDEEINNLSFNEESAGKGRPRVDKAGLVELAQKLIEKKLLVPFEDEKPIDKYTLQDFEELFEANVNEHQRKIREEVPSEFFSSLPEELQFAAKYVADGGTDLKGLFRTLAQVEEVRQMTPDDENDAKQIVRGYLQATNFGNPDEIEEEITAWEDRGELQNKAAKFKPKLDAMTERQVQYQLAQQEQLRKQQAAQAQMYMDNVYKTLEPGDLNGLKLDRRTQNLLFQGLVQPRFPSVSGKQTNLLGHLLEKYQFVEPNHSLVAEALWLLADPDGYKNRVREVTKKEVVADTVRKLKVEQSNRLASHNEPVDEKPESKPRGIPRPTSNFFKRS